MVKVGRGVVVVLVNFSPRHVTPTSSVFLVHSVSSQNPFLQSAMVGSEPSQSRLDSM